MSESEKLRLLKELDESNEKLGRLFKEMDEKLKKSIELSEGK